MKDEKQIRIKEFSWTMEVNIPRFDMKKPPIQYQLNIWNLGPWIQVEKNATQTEN